MPASLALLGTYIGVVVPLQVVAIVLSQIVGAVSPSASLFVFLGLYVTALGVGWPIAVRITDRLMPETEEERAAAAARTLTPDLRHLRTRVS